MWKHPQAITILILVLSAIVFVVDCLMPLGVAGGIPYVAVVVIALFAPRPSYILMAALLGTLLTIVGFLVSPDAGSTADWKIYVNRLEAIFAIWATAAVCVLHKRSLVSLVDRTARLQAILEGAVDAIITINEKGVIESYNRSAAELFAYSTDDLKGKNVKMLMPIPYRHEHDEYVLNYLRTGQAKIIGHGREVIGQKKDGSTFPMHLAVSEAWLFNKRIFIGIVRDISDLTSARKKLIQSERLAATGQMLSAIAHESRNALQRIQASVEMLQLDLPDRPEAQDELGRIEKAGDNLRTLFEELRSYAAPIQLNPVTADISSIWQLAWTNLAAQRKNRNVELIEHVAGVDLRLCIDEFRIEQVFRNLFENSLAACRDPVCIEVSATENELDGAPAVCVSVRDNGPGIAKDKVTQIFQAFFATNSRGSGLGMPIARRLIEAHHGKIEFNDSGRGGAEFLIHLPRA